jgi:hypothetical protein
MSAFPKADIQSVRIGVDLNGCLWPKADIRILKYSITSAFLNSKD